MRSICWPPSPATRPSGATATGPTCSATARSPPARSAAICSTCTASARTLYALSDPLCDALQVLNHLQDCKDDYRALDRVYLPQDRFAAAGIGVEELARPSASPALRRVLDDVLAGVDRLLLDARDLPSALRSRRLGAEAAVILAIARRLAAELRRRDPLAERVELGRAALGALRPVRPRPDAAAGAPPSARAGGAVAAAMTVAPPRAMPPVPGPDLDPARARAHVEGVVAASGSSFYWSMRLLPRAKRDAMYAIYAFCREVDDIADGDAPPPAKLAELRGWRAEIAALFAGRPSRPTTCALALPVSRFDLPRAEFDAMLDGMEMDAGERMQAPPLALLERYCRCVAGAVGLLSVRVFGARGPRLDQGALALGEALQLTNILRDLAEDAARGRLYLPRELLEREGVASRDPDRVLAHPALPEVCGALAERARRRFAEAELLLASGDRRQLRPALVMMQVYRRTLERLIARGWQRLDQPVRVAQARAPVAGAALRPALSGWRGSTWSGQGSPASPRRSGCASAASPWRCTRRRRRPAAAAAPTTTAASAG